jgi:hypothetical protein
VIPTGKSLFFDLMTEAPIHRAAEPIRCSY